MPSSRSLVILLCVLMALPSGAAMSWPGGDEPASPAVVETAASGGCHGHAGADAAAINDGEHGTDADRPHRSDCCADNCLCACVLPAVAPPGLMLTQPWTASAVPAAVRLPAPRAVDAPPLRPPIAA